MYIKWTRNGFLHTLTTMKFVQLLSVLLLAAFTSAINVTRSRDMFGYLVNLKATVQNMKKDFANMKKDFAAERSNVTGSLKGFKSDVASLKKEVKGDDLKGMREDIASLKKEVKDGGAVFTRWGRTVCPVGNDLVYKGYAAGQHYSHKAAASNILCLPEDPIYSKNTPGPNGEAVIYGVEFESRLVSPNMKKLLDQDVPCAVCRSRSRSSHVMIAGRNKCESGWKSEYDGYLMGPRFDFASGEYLCVDKHPESIAGGHKNDDGQLLLLVESRCGSLPCPPYKDNLELTCVVCTH